MSETEKKKTIVPRDADWDRKAPVKTFAKEMKIEKKDKIEKKSI